MRFRIFLTALRFAWCSVKKWDEEVRFEMVWSPAVFDQRYMTSGSKDALGKLKNDQKTDSGKGY